jgi:hypothetical protein
MMHRVEDWRERLLAEGDKALAALLDDYPQADRQQLRTLVRNAQAEKAKNKPPRAYREIYQVLRALMLPAALGLKASAEDAGHIEPTRPTRTESAPERAVALAIACSGLGTADGDALDQQRRLADTHRHALPVLATDTHALVQGQVVADHAHLLHGFRTVADQGRALHRRGDAAILDQVGLGGREHVLAAGDVDLAAAEVHRIQALLHRTDHFLRVVLPARM